MARIVSICVESAMHSILLLSVILLLRIALAKHISAKFWYGIWFLLLLRLVVPFTLKSTVQLLPEFPAQRQNPIAVAAPTIFFGIWAGGVALLLGWNVYKNQKMKAWILQNQTEASEATQQIYNRQHEKLNLKKLLPMSVQKDLHSPALLVALKPMILLPATQNIATLRYGVLHELTHYCRKDHLVLLVWKAMCCLYWFNPAIWIAYAYMKEDMEAACDASVVQYQSKVQRKEYAQTLIRLAADERALPVLGMKLMQKRKMENRIRQIMRSKKKRLNFISATVVVLLVALMGFTTLLAPFITQNKIEIKTAYDDVLLAKGRMDISAEIVVPGSYTE